MGEVKGRLRRSLSKWASSADMEARELKEGAVKAGCCPIVEATDRQRCRAAGQPAHGHAPSPRRGTRPRGRALRRLGADHPGVARAPADRRASSRAARSRSSAASACRTRCVSCSTRATSCGDRRLDRRPARPGRRRDRRAGRARPAVARPSAAGAACSRPRCPPWPSRSCSSPPSTCRSQSAISVGDLRSCCWWSGWCSARTAQFVLNSLVGIGIGAFFAWRSARGGGDADDQALAYFLPGMIYNAGYAGADGAQHDRALAASSASWSAALPATRPSGTATRRWSGCAAT